LPEKHSSFFFIFAPRFTERFRRVQFLNSFKQEAGVFIKENATLLLTAGGVVGTVGTGVLAARGGMKYAEILAIKKEDLIHETLDGFKPGRDPVVPAPQLDKLTKVKLAVPYFGPPILLGSVTIASIIMSHRMSAQKIAGLAAAYGLAERNLEEYKAKISEKLTGPKKQQVEDEIAQERVAKTPGHETIIIGSGKILCFDACTGRYFESTVEKIRAAMNTINSEILQNENARASDFYELIGLSPTTWTDEVGWNRDHLPELRLTSGKTDDERPYISIDFSVLPKTDYQKHY
jgi:hypothetical protein